MGLGGLKEAGGYDRLWEKSKCCHMVESAVVRGFDFAARSSAGRSKPRPYEGKGEGNGNFKFQIRKTANAKANTKATATAKARATANADPSPLKGIRDDGGWVLFSA